MDFEKPLIISGMLVASLCGGALVNLLVDSQVGAQAPPSLTTTQLNVVDEEGRLRGVLSGEDERGAVSLSFYDESGQVRGVFGIEQSGSPVIRLFGSAGESRILATVENEDPLLVVGDERGRSALLGSISGAPALRFVDAGRVLAQLQLDEQSEPSFAFFTSEGRRSVTISVGTMEEPVVTLYERGRPRVTFGVVRQAAVLNLLDTEQPRLVIGVADNGRPSVNFLNENGEVVGELP